MAQKARKEVKEKAKTKAAKVRAGNRSPNGRVKQCGRAKAKAKIKASKVQFGKPQVKEKVKVKLRAKKPGSAMCVVSLATLRPTAGRTLPTRGFKQFKSSNSNHQRGMSRNTRLLQAPLPPGVPKLCVLRLVIQRSFCTTLT